MSEQISKPLRNHEGYRLVRKNYKWGLVDGNDNTLLDCVYDLIRQVDDNTLDLFYEGEWWAVDINLLPLSFSFASPCKECDLMIAKKGSKYGVADRSGNVIIPVIHDRIEEYNGYFWTRENRIKENEVSATHKDYLFSFCIANGEYVSLEYSITEHYKYSNSFKSYRMPPEVVHTIEVCANVRNNDGTTRQTKSVFGRRTLTQDDIERLKQFKPVDAIIRICLFIDEDGTEHFAHKCLALVDADKNLFKPSGAIIDYFIEIGNTYEVYDHAGKRIVDAPFGVTPSYDNGHHKSLRNGLHFVDVKDIFNSRHLKHNILDKSFHKLLPVDFDSEVAKLDFWHEVSAWTAGRLTFGEDTCTEYIKFKAEHDDWCVLEIASGMVLFNLGAAEFKDVVYSSVEDFSPLMLCWRPNDSLPLKQFVSLSKEQRTHYMHRKSVVDIFIGSALMWSVKCDGYSDFKYIGKDYFIAKSLNTGRFGIIGSNGIIIPFEYDKRDVSSYLLKETTNVTVELPSTFDSQNQRKKSNFDVYKKIGESKYGYTPVCNADDKWGLLDENGQELYSLKYDSIEDIYPGGFAQAKLGEEQGLVDRNGQPLFKFGIEKYYGGKVITPEDRTKTFCVKYNNKTGLMGPGYKMLVPCLYNSYINPLEKDYYTFKIDNQEGVLSSDPYKIIISPRKGSISIYSNRYGDYIGETLFTCQYQNDDGEWTKDFFNSTGELIYSVTSAEVWYIYEDIFVELKETRNFDGEEEKVYNIYSNTQKRIIASYSDCYISNHEYLQVERDGKWGIFDMKKGIEVIECKYSFIGNDWIARNNFIPGEDLIAMNINNKCGYIDINENQIIPPVFDKGKRFSEGLAPVSINGKWGYIDKIGNIVIQCKFSNAAPFSNGLAAVTKGNGWGYIDPEGNTVIPFIYERVCPFEGETAEASTDSGEGYITASGARLYWEEHKYERYDSHQFDDVINEVYENDDGEWDNYWIDRC